MLLTYFHNNWEGNANKNNVNSIILFAIPAVGVRLANRHNGHSPSGIWTRPNIFYSDPIPCNRTEETCLYCSSQISLRVLQCSVCSGFFDTAYKAGCHSEDCSSSTTSCLLHEQHESLQEPIGLPTRHHYCRL
jgi:hypothetical protein